MTASDLVQALAVVLPVLVALTVHVVTVRDWRRGEVGTAIGNSWEGVAALAATVGMAVKEAKGNADARRERLKICRYDGFPTKETSVDLRDTNLLLSETPLVVTRSGRNPRLGLKLALGSAVLFLSTL